MRYSIVVPVCNSGDYLLRFMHPFLKYQGDYEVVFVDDGSDDDSLKRCERLKKRFPAIQIVRQEKKGVLAARLRGLEESTGDYVWFAQPEDFVDERAFPVLDRVLEENDPDVILFPTDDYKNGRYVPKSELFLNESRFLENYEVKDFLEKMILHQYSNSICTKIFSRRVLKEKVCAEPVTIGEGFLQSLPYLNDAKNFYFCSQVLYHHRHGLESEKMNLAWFDSIRVVDEEMEQYAKMWAEKWKIDPGCVSIRFMRDAWLMIRKLAASDIPLEGEDVRLFLEGMSVTTSFAEKYPANLSGLSKFFFYHLFLGHVGVCTWILQRMRNKRQRRK